MKVDGPPTRSDAAEVERYEHVRCSAAGNDHDDGLVLAERCVVIRRGMPAWLAMLHSDVGAASSRRPNARMIRPTLDALGRALVDVTLAMAVGVVAHEVTA